MNDGGNENRTLAKEAVSVWQLVFFGHPAPIGILGFGPLIAAVAFALGATPLSFVIGLVAALLAGNTIFQYSKSVVNAGGYYGYVRNGLGQHAGTFIAFLYALYEIANVSFFVVFRVWVFASTFRVMFGISLPIWSGIIYVLLSTAPAFWLAYRGVRPSVKVSLIQAFFQVILVVGISVAVILEAHDNSFAPFTPLAPAGWSGVFLGFIAGSYLLYAGYGQIITLGEEAKAPTKTVGLAVLIIILFAGFYYILGAYAMTVGWGTALMSSFVHAVTPGSTVIGKAVGHGFVDIVDAIFFFTLFSLTLSYFTPITRVLFALSRDKLLPRKLSFIHPRYLTPSYAIFTAVLIITGVSVTVGLTFYLTKGYSGLLDAWIGLSITATITTLIVHAITNTSLSISSWKGTIATHRTKTVTILVHGIVPLASTILIILVLYFAIYKLPPVYIGAIIGIIAYSAIVAIYIFMKRDIIKGSSVTVGGPRVER